MLTRYTAFLTHVDNYWGKCQCILRKKWNHVGKKVADVGFVWYPETLFQPNEILIGTSPSCRKYGEAHSFPTTPYTGNQCPLAIVCNLHIFPLSCRFE